MKRVICRSATIGLLLTLCALANATDHSEPALSAAQTAVISKQIATLKSPVDRHIAQNWNNAKKIAELICRPVALSTLKKQTKTADRVFLGTDAPESLALESNRRLIGTGEVRTQQGWHNFTFTCNLNPTTGKVVDFRAIPN